MNEQIKNKNVIKYLFALAIVVFAMPSIIYFLSGNILFDVKSEYNYLLQNWKINLLNAIMFISLFTIISLIYFEIIKKTKELFKTINKLIIFILIISILFAIVLPFTSTDVYYYMSTGWSEAKYGVNPYYIPVQQVIDTKIDSGVTDEILEKIPYIWRNQTIVYGPLWPLMCRILTSFSNGSLEICLIIFKLLNLIIHILNCYIIYKITSRKKFVAMYGLNPFILFETLSNVHNDIIVVFFILLAIFLLRKKKQIIPAICLLAFATAIKYYAILLAPFFVMYYLKDKPLKKKIIYTILLAILFIVIVAVFYLIYVQDLYVLKGIQTQQEKLAKSIYLIIGMYPTLSLERGIIVSNIATTFFISGYIILICKEFFQKTEKITFRNYMQKYNIVMIVFIFLIITNFQTWYIMWLFPAMFFLKGKNIKSILQLSIIAELSELPFFAISPHYGNGVWYLLIMVIMFFGLKVFERIRKKKGEKLSCQD